MVNRYINMQHNIRKKWIIKRVCYIEQLPNEIFLEICKYISYIDLIKTLMRVSRKYKILINLYLKYTKLNLNLVLNEYFTTDNNITFKYNPLITSNTIWNKIQTMDVIDITNKIGHLHWKLKITINDSYHNNNDWKVCVGIIQDNKNMGFKRVEWKWQNDYTPAYGISLGSDVNLIKYDECFGNNRVVETKLLIKNNNKIVDIVVDYSSTICVIIFIIDKKYILKYNFDRSKMSCFYPIISAVTECDITIIYNKKSIDDIYYFNNG